MTTSLEAEENVEGKLSPMMVQWHACKEASKGSLLFFRLGDFYEAFYEDAVLLSQELDLTLTKRQEIPMAGVPAHAAENYIDRLVAKGIRVAIAEQTEDPKKTKGIVKREVVRIVTAGTVVTSSLLSEKNNNFFASVTRVNHTFGLAILDLTTGEFRVIEFDEIGELLNELHRLRPAEILTSQKFSDKHSDLWKDLKQAFAFLLTCQEDWRFEHQLTYDFLVRHFQVQTLDGFGLKGLVAAINAAGSLLHYLKETLNLSIDHLTELNISSSTDFLLLDRSTQRHLELTESLHEGGERKHTLLSVLDHTLTPMGGRLLRQWVKRPLLYVELIQARQNAVESFLHYAQDLNHFQYLLTSIRDLERLILRIQTGHASPRDLVGLRFSLEPLSKLKQSLASLCSSSTLIASDESEITPLPELVELLSRALVDEPPLRITEGKLFRDGFHAELDDLRSIGQDNNSWIASYQTKIREETGIKTLKVSYNKLSGFYIEVSKGQTERMPNSFQRRQTLVNAERYISPELKEYETKILTSQERIAALESELFQQLRTHVATYAAKILHSAKAIARLDCLQSLAEAARLSGYVKPIIDHSLQLTIEEGRHPVIEKILSGETFVSNNTEMDAVSNRLLLITGPNMAGKSTYLRQVALIVIMAQIGSYVPAKHAHIGLVDKVFTRIGASDDLARGQSTFMVEMIETANILNNATDRSLVILDEIGRGTSTYDGISIAWSVAEYLLTCEGRKAKTLFATHYWELTKLEEKIPGAVNYNVAVHEGHDQIVFLRKIVRGDTDKSYGIHVARLAGLPQEVLQRAGEILVHLEENANRKTTFEPAKVKRMALPKPKVTTQKIQLSFFE